MTVKSVHQFHSHSGYGDAITNSMLFIREMLRSLGFVSEIFVQFMDPTLSDRLSLLADYSEHADQVLLVHHSCGIDIQDEILALKDKKILVYHNITPPEFFPPGSMMRASCKKGLRQTRTYRTHVQATIADSEFNAMQLLELGFENTEVIPLLLDMDRISQHRYNMAIAGSKSDEFTMLFVGRILPHKCQHELVEAFGEFVNRWEGQARLVLVGSHDGDLAGYYGKVLQTVEANSLGSRVKLTGQVDDSDLYGWYRAADLFVCLSEHEGFCVPLLESMVFDVPILGYRSAAVPFTLNNAGYMIDRKTPVAVADAMLDIASNHGLRETVIETQRERRQEFAPEFLKSRLVKFLADQGIYPPSASPDLHLEPDKVTSAQNPDRSEPGRGEANPDPTKSAIRVGWVSTYSSVCGIAEYSRYLLQHIDERQIEVKVYAGRPLSSVPDANDGPGFWERHSEPSLLSLASQIVSDGMDCVVIQFHFAFFKTAHMPSFLEKLRRNGVHSLICLHSTEDRQDSIDHMLDALRICDRILVHSRNDVQRLRSMGLEKNVTYFPHGALFRQSRNRTEQRAKLGLTSCDPIIGSYGFLLPHKGIRQLIQAMPTILKEYPRSLLLLVDAVYPVRHSTEERHECQEEIKNLNLQRNVVLIDDFLDPEESLFLLEACDLLVFPYQYSGESHSGAATFGMAGGRPVLATRIGIFSELEDVVGFLPGIDPPDIARGVLELLEDRGLRQRIRDRQFEWLQEHDWGRVSRKLQHMIETAVNDNSCEYDL